MVRILENTLFNGGKAFIRAAGLSTDTKPTLNVITGSRFSEVDTGAEYEYDEAGAHWYQVGLTSAEVVEAIEGWLDDNPTAVSDAVETVVDTQEYKEAVAAYVRGMVDETVTGTTPSITGEANHRYLCGEVSTISITPPASGIIDVIFTSGSVAAVLTLPNTVKMPDWFDATSLDADTIYEINIVDGIYGVVTTWAAT